MLSLNARRPLEFARVLDAIDGPPDAGVVEAFEERIEAQEHAIAELMARLEQALQALTAAVQPAYGD